MTLFARMTAGCTAIIRDRAGVRPRTKYLWHCHLPAALLGALLLLEPQAATAADSAPFRFWVGTGPAVGAPGLRLRGAVRLLHRGRPALHELSGLTWDADEQLFYAVSDNGYVAHLRPRFEAGELRTVEVAAVHALSGPVAGRAPAARSVDAEGLAARFTRNGKPGDAELLISFEIEPRIGRYDREGRYLGAIELPDALRRRRVYAAPNQSLEALTLHPEFGPLVGPERPLPGMSSALVRLYALNGRSWYLPAIDARYGSLAGLETTPDGRVLLLERRIVNLLQPIRITLRAATLSADSEQAAAVAEVASFDSSRGWAVDNFESVAWLDDQRYCMVSDDNSSLLQNTVLVCFELLPPVEAMAK